MDTESAQNAIKIGVDFVTVYGLQVIGAILILIVGRIVAGLIAKGVGKAATKAHIDVALVGFFSKMVYFAVMAFAVVAALEKFGVKTTSFVAVLGAAGLAVGLALQGSLSNFASGVMLLLFRPFRVGDFIDAAGVKGSVKEIGVLTTILHSPDNQKIIIPNGQIFGGTITNVTALDTRRVDMTAGIAYGDDIGKAKQVYMEILRSHPKVLEDPEPVVKVLELGDSSVNLIVRPWVKTEDYWDVYFDVILAIKEESDKNGLSIPFPQQDVHMHQVN